MSKSTEIKPICGACKKSFAGRSTLGGIIFNGRPIGPCCSDEYIRLAEKTGEQKFIDGVCPFGMSFEKFVERYFESLPSERISTLIQHRRHCEKKCRETKKEMEKAGNARRK